MKLTDNTLRRYKAIIIEIAKYFDKFCCENNLAYFAIGGTAIGALRHDGIIPWDDDIDLVMPRPDYERFLKLSHKIDKKFDIFTHKTHPFYHLPYAKMCDANTSLLPSFRHKCVIGAFIDIFPMDGLPNTTELGRIKYFNNFMKIRKIASGINTYCNLNDMFHAIYRRDFMEIKSQLISFYYHIMNKQNDFFLKCDNFLAQYSYENADYVAYFGTNRGHKIISPKDYFNSYYYQKFEDFEIRLPIGIHKYLTNVYGDYMTPPEPKNRVLLHSYYYLNLNARLSYNEILSELNNK